MAIGKKTADLGMTSYDKLFLEEQETEQRENIQQILLEELHPFKNHPFRVLDDEKMAETVDSVREFGVLVPAIARPRPEGGYELIAGHRRHRASVLAGKETMPVIIRDMDDDAATIIMVDSNLQRETLLFSEKAWAYRMKLEAMKRQAGRPSSKNYSQVGNNFGSKTSSDALAKQVGESKNTIFRYIRLTYLVEPLLNLVDEKRLSFNPGVELSYISEKGQEMICDKLTYEDSFPSIAQAKQLRQLGEDDKLSEKSIMAVMRGEGIERFYPAPVKEEPTPPPAEPEEPKGPEQPEPAVSQQVPELVQPENVVEFPQAPTQEKLEPGGPAQPEEPAPEIPQPKQEPPTEQMETATPDPAQPSEVPQIPPEVVAQAVQQAQQQMTPPPSPPQPAEDEISINITMKKSKFQKYFPKDYTPAQMEQVIIKLLEDWYRKRQIQKGMAR
ncbi:ParB/RepB/Spo0J family partition protein [Anaerotruncus rubiinfantis]|uniref:ParB/RepB/Spo0J family partition protein n=1 Tax=Anaerotruncus rubiinfantis TaxID=1720200 RepID=UPI001FAA806A|nr:ParB/RepB/Spo0J family partition protein [Anaerotruncus rubiinfantis]